jgi:hypothetical protein
MFDRSSGLYSSHMSMSRETMKNMRNCFKLKNNSMKCVILNLNKCYKKTVLGLLERYKYGSQFDISYVAMLTT